MQWLRLYHDTAHDPKWRLVAVESGQPLATVLGVWTYMLVFASQAKNRGTLEGWDDRLAGAALDLKGDVMASIRHAMQGVVLDGDILTGWERRQRSSDNVADRVRKHRQKHTPATPDNDPSSVTDKDETEHKENVTLRIPSVTLHSNGVTGSSLRAQTPDSELEEEKKEESPPTPPPGEACDLFGNLASLPVGASGPVGVQPEAGSVPIAEPTKPAKPKKARPAALYTQAEIEDWFEKFMVAYPNRDKVHSVNGAKKIFGAMLKRQVSPEAIIAAATRYCQEVRNNGHFGTQYTKDAYNWLNEGKWKDYSGVHMFPVPEPEWKTNPRAWTDRNHPPPWPDAPLGAKAGMWTKTSRIWVRYAS